MSNGLELPAIDNFFYLTASADAALTALLGVALDPDVNPGVYVDTVPAETTYPYVLATMRATGDTLTSDGTIVLTRADYLIKGVDRAESYEGLRPIAQRLHQLFHQAEGVVADGLVLKCIRQQAIHYPEIHEDVSYRHLGGIYRFWVEGT